MTQAKKQKNIHHGVSVFDAYIVPLFMLGLGLVLIILAFTISLPEAKKLSEIRGHVGSYHFYQTGRGQGDYATIILLQEGPRLWTKAISKETAKAIFRQQGMEVLVYINPNSTDVPMDGAIKAYGLWVDGKQIQSQHEAISQERLIVRICFPALGLFFAAMAIFSHRRNKAKYVS